MRLYTRTGATALTDPETGVVYEADELGGFNFPDDLSDKLHKFAVRGQPMWESDIERQRRLMHEEVERRKDPATLLSAVEQIVAAAARTATLAKAEAPAVDTGATAPAPVEPEAAEASAVAEKAPRAPRKTAASRRPKAE